MKKVQQFRKALVKGEVKKTDPVKSRENVAADEKEVIKVVMDSTAQKLILDSELELAEAKKKEMTKAVLVWEEVKEKATSKKADGKKTETK